MLGHAKEKGGKKFVLSRTGRRQLQLRGVKGRDLGGGQVKPKLPENSRKKTDPTPTGGLLPIVGYTERLLPKGNPLIKGREIYCFSMLKGRRNTLKVKEIAT